MAAGAGHARESIWQYFVTKCSNNLHIVLAMSPVGDALRTRCRNFPGKNNFWSQVERPLDKRSI